jgi:hypothetical protein
MSHCGLLESMAATHGSVCWSERLTAEVAVNAALLLVALIVGLTTAADYGATIDEFNANDYGPKALAWYTSGFTDRSQFETVEFSLWYYGPWFQMITAAVQSLGLAEPLAVRHALTFVVGLLGIATVCPIGRLSFGPWVGLSALTLCLLTGYLYGNLFFAPIDIPFLATMCWALLAIMVMARTTVPTWPATVCTGIAIGLTIATRTGGIINQLYLVGTMALCAVEALVLAGSSARRAMVQIAVRSCAAIMLAWIIAWVLWPWLQIGNPLTQFKIAYTHFVTLVSEFQFVDWGRWLWTNALPWSYIPDQWLARLPIGFLALLALAVLLAIFDAMRFIRLGLMRFRRHGALGLRRLVLLITRGRNILLIWIAAILPLSFVMTQQASLYDGVRHTLFIVPLLAAIAGWAAVRLWHSLGRLRVLAAVFATIYAACLAADLIILHPLEYIAMNAFAGGTAGAYRRFELDYWSAASTEALKQLENRLDGSGAFAAGQPSILVCIPHREHMITSMLGSRWRVELDPEKADFVIESERWRCAKDHPILILVDEVTRYNRAFAWTYINQRSGYFDLSRSQPKWAKGQTAMSKIVE